MGSSGISAPPWHGRHIEAASHLARVAAFKRQHVVQVQCSLYRNPDDTKFALQFLVFYFLLSWTFEANKHDEGGTQRFWMTRVPYFFGMILFVEFQTILLQIIATKWPTPKAFFVFSMVNMKLPKIGRDNPIELDARVVFSTWLVATHRFFEEKKDYKLPNF